MACAVNQAPDWALKPPHLLPLVGSCVYNLEYLMVVFSTTYSTTQVFYEAEVGIRTAYLDVVVLGLA